MEVNIINPLKDDNPLVFLNTAHEMKFLGSLELNIRAEGGILGENIDYMLIFLCHIRLFIICRSDTFNN